MQAEGILYIVPTPIGNLEDITLRAVRILKEVDLIAAEDTRHTKKLLNHLGIRTPLLSYYREKEAQRGAEIIDMLKSGKNIALVSDAGTPAISDPGSVLVGLAHDNGINVTPLPGASALTTALSAAGLDYTGFLFIGFLPSKKGQRSKILNSLIHSDYPVAIYESPRRISSLLNESLEIFGNRQAFLARELSKRFEELQRADLETLLEKTLSCKNRGEFVLIICPGIKDEVKGETVEELILWYRDNSKLSLKDVSKRIASDIGTSRSQVYQMALKLWNKQ
ncbi:MAG: 16S rRNA (cytidine(1402)-2'-O)-methyltransferase [Deltaproteobacteria bacterium]|nr:16S rRNA (cytidine(1402)-2'-O)-methyltransferase [Deltaproteobacteria bacterium]